MSPTDRILALCKCNKLLRDADVHGPSCTVDEAARITEEAVAEEREACAAVADAGALGTPREPIQYETARGIAAAIRARGKAL